MNALIPSLIRGDFNLLDVRDGRWRNDQVSRLRHVSRTGLSSANETYNFRGLSARGERGAELRQDADRNSMKEFLHFRFSSTT